MADVNYLAYAKAMEPPDIANAFTSGITAGGNLRTAQLKNALVQNELSRQEAFQQAMSAGDEAAAAGINPQAYMQYAHGKAYLGLGEHYKTQSDLERTKALKEDQVMALTWFDKTFPYVTQSRYPDFYAQAKTNHPQYVHNIPSPEEVSAMTPVQWQNYQGNVLTKFGLEKEKLKGDLAKERSLIGAGGRIEAAKIGAGARIDAAKIVAEPKKSNKKIFQAGVEGSPGARQPGYMDEDDEGNPVFVPTGPPILPKEGKEQFIKPSEYVEYTKAKQGGFKGSFFEWKAQTPTGKIMKSPTQTTSTIKWNKDRPPTPEEAQRLLQGLPVD